MPLRPIAWRLGPHNESRLPVCRRKACEEMLAAIEKVQVSALFEWLRVTQTLKPAESVMELHMPRDLGPPRGA